MKTLKRGTSSETALPKSLVLWHKMMKILVPVPKLNEEKFLFSLVVDSIINGGGVIQQQQQEISWADECESVFFGPTFGG